MPGVTIKQDVDPTTDRDTYAKQLLQAGKFPDLLESITPSLYTSAGLLTPYPSSWINANFILPNNIKGKDYIPPTNSQIIPLVYYNKTLFAKAGVTPPTTWAEFMADCAKLKAARHRADRARRPRLLRRGDAAHRRAERGRARLGPELDPAALRRHGRSSPTRTWSRRRRRCARW